MPKALWNDKVIAESEQVEIYEVDARSGERRGTQPNHRKTTGADGIWGPFVSRADAHYEFVLKMEGQPTTHTYRTPFLRSSDVVHLRPQPFAKGDEAAQAIVIMSRPRGYFGVGRDKFSLDGKVPPGINQGVPGVATGKLLLPLEPLRPVPARFNDEAITVQNWPAREGHIVFAEFHY